jgi:hypothetical protein
MIYMEINPAFCEQSMSFPGNREKHPRKTAWTMVTIRKKRAETLFSLKPMRRMAALYFYIKKRPPIKGRDSGF